MKVTFVLWRFKVNVFSITGECMASLTIKNKCGLLSSMLLFIFNLFITSVIITVISVASGRPFNLLLVISLFFPTVTRVKLSLSELLLLVLIK